MLGATKRRPALLELQQRPDSFIFFTRKVKKPTYFEGAPNQVGLSSPKLKN